MPRARVLAASLFAVTLATIAAAQEEPAGQSEEVSRPTPDRKIEEIVVTAQKREQFIEDVPISMSVVDDQFIAEQGITDVREAMLFVPNAKIEVAGFFAAPRVRGFTFNNNNKAFEPPAGLALDGVPYSRIGYFASALFDVDRVEVLRGPQGITFGKNTTSGLINIITKNPTDDYTGFADVQIGERDRRRFEMGVSGPILRDFLNIRLAGLKEDEDGFVDNTTAAIVSAANDDFRGRDRTPYWVPR